MSILRPLACVSTLALLAVAGLATACGDDGKTEPTVDAGPDAAVGIDAGEAGTDVDPGGGATITIGKGQKPGLAVDGAGTAYIAWYGPEKVTNTLQLCRLPRGAAGCDRTTTIPAPGTTLTRPFVTIDGSTVRVVSHRYGLTGERFEAVYMFTSSDRGVTFDAGRPFGSPPYSDAIVGPGDAVSFATSAYTAGEVFERAPSGGSAPPANRALLSTTHLYAGTLALVDDASLLLASHDLAANAQFRRWAGAGDANDPSTWSAPVDLGKLEYLQLAAGPAGLFLKGVTQARTLEVRTFDGSTFGAGVPIPEGTGELPQSDLTQDGAGRLHAVWPRIDVDGTRFYYATSDDGAAWQTARVLTTTENLGQMRVATAADHIGIAAWEGSNEDVKVLALGPAAK